ncbi:DNA-binding MarR family transcriptional regulator [Kitasatospora sp. SolWspMP-SS2h]|uniref:MarR family winged helix-turn-helix transcriptional regulator n=1 Tax=Kitasatospora sp. SolWspMP-SS2h TaxID=1305729 RepID=UPI000DBA509E|nr:MarR family transcriptional regulator [Kitasatospora sp. SolWspMP-SS2h]RAJ29839.1 DNA-binding MarR family transcriptional regulator [Kitasatospora sp. SolWspMP-SS2h]
MDDPLMRVWEPDEVAVMEALRDWAVGFAELNHHLAAWVRLPTSDARALAQIVWAAQAGAPLSPTALAQRIGMSTGATTVLLHRLQKAELVSRSRENGDRRRVTLRPTPTALAQSRAFMQAAGAEIGDTLRHSSTADLRTATALLGALNEAVTQGIHRLRARHGGHEPGDDGTLSADPEG